MQNEQMEVLRLHKTQGTGLSLQDYRVSESNKCQSEPTPHIDRVDIAKVRVVAGFLLVRQLIFFSIRSSFLKNCSFVLALDTADDKN